MQKWFIFGQDPDFDAGLRFVEQRRFGEAAVALETCLEQEPKDPLRKMAIRLLVTAFSKMAEQNLWDGQYLEAIQLFKRAVELEPSFADLQFKTGVSYWLIGDEKAARQHVQAALELNPEYGNAQAFCAFLTGDTTALDQRSEVWQNLIQNRDSANPEELLKAALKAPRVEDIERAKALVVEERHDDARLLLEELVQRLPEYADLHSTLGECYLGLDQLEQAATQFEHALMLNPKFVHARSMAGVTYRRLRDEPRAKEMFEQVLMLDPLNPIATAELARLRRSI